MVHIQQGDEALQTHERSALHSAHSGKGERGCCLALSSHPTELSTDAEPKCPVLVGAICKQKEVSGSWQEHLRRTVNLTRSNCLSTQGL